MRYMGALDTASVISMSPELKATLLANAGTMPDDQARDVYDVAVATPYGHRQELVRLGVGGAVGLVVGIILGKVLLK